MNALLSYCRSSIGKKTIVAVTGLLLILFVTGHLVGNLQFFLPPEWINAYGHKLQSLGALLWVIRLGLLAVVGTHILATISLTLQNRKARPQGYAVPAYRASTAASRTMIVSGLILVCFIVFHLLHFTVRVVPGHTYNEEIHLVDGTVVNHEIGGFTKHWGIPLGDVPAHTVHNVHDMMVAGFQRWYISAFYIVGMFLLCMHLSHGAASFVQTFGLRSRQIEKGLTIGSRLFAWAIFLGYSSIPASVLLGLVKATGSTCCK